MAKQQVAAAAQPDVTLPPREHDIERLQDVATIDVLLSPEEVALKGIELAEADQQLSALAAEKKAWLSDWRDRNKKLAGHRDVLADQVVSGKEERDVPVYADHDLTANTVIVRRADTEAQEIITPAREMTAKERENVMQLRQTPIPGTEEPGEAEKAECVCLTHAKDPTDTVWECPTCGPRRMSAFGEILPSRAPVTQAEPAP